MTWRLMYGDTQLAFDAPAERAVRMLAATPITPLLDATQAVRDALDSPTGEKRLRDLAAGARAVLIVVGDTLQRGGLPTVLHQILDVLQDSGVGLRQVSILVARGLRGRMDSEEMESLVGSEVWNRVVVRQHDPSEAGTLEDLGETEAGTPLFLNRALMESGQLLLLVGLLTPHGTTGFEGGPSLILPGLASRDALMANRRLALSETGAGFKPECRAGELENNPVYGDALEAADKVDPDFLVHTVLDEEGRMVKVVAGDWKKAYELGCDWLRQRQRVTLHEKRAWAVASAGGPPWDQTLQSSLRALRESAGAVQDGGDLIFLAACAGGVGRPEFEKAAQRSPLELHAELRRGGSPEDFLALALRAEAARVRIHLVSGLPPATVEAMGLHPHASLESAWSSLEPGFPAGAAGYVIPGAARVLILPAQAREPASTEQRASVS